MGLANGVALLMESYGLFSSHYTHVKIVKNLAKCYSPKKVYEKTKYIKKNAIRIDFNTVGILCIPLIRLIPIYCFLRGWKKMIELLVNATSEQMIRHKVISHKDLPLIRYGLQAMTETLLIASTMILVSIFGGQILEALAWIGTVFIIRSLGGGRHAGTFLQCYFISVGVFIACMLIVHLVEDSFISYLIGWGAALLLVLSKVLLRKRPKQVKLQKISTLITAFLIFIYGIFLWFHVTDNIMLASLLGLVASHLSNFFGRNHL
jgi:accessory gene regulator B